MTQNPGQPEMHAADVATLFDFNYWCNRQILEATRRASAEEWAGPAEFTYRNLRGTLVHALDVELSWRARLRGEPAEIWDRSLAENDFPEVSTLVMAWASDETEMRHWLATLRDSDLGAVVDLHDSDRFPLWYYLIHVITHSEQQRRDAALILNALGHQVPDLEFLYYADTLAAR